MSELTSLHRRSRRRQKMGSLTAAACPMIEFMVSVPSQVAASYSQTASAVLQMKNGSSSQSSLMEQAAKQDTHTTSLVSRRVRGEIAVVGGRRRSSRPLSRPRRPRWERSDNVNETASQMAATMKAVVKLTVEEVIGIARGCPALEVCKQITRVLVSDSCFVSSPTAFVPNQSGTRLRFNLR